MSARKFRSLDERIESKELELERMKTLAARRKANAGGGLPKKLSRLVSLLRSVEKDDQGDLAVYCGAVASNLEGELQKIVEDENLTPRFEFPNKPAAQSA